MYSYPTTVEELDASWELITTVNIIQYADNNLSFVGNSRHTMVITSYNTFWNNFYNVTYYSPDTKSVNILDVCKNHTSEHQNIL